MDDGMWNRGPKSAIHLAIAFALVAPLPVQAQTSGDAVYGGSPASVTLGVTVRAKVSATCGFTTGGVPGGTYPVGEVDRSYSIDIAFRLACNSPSRVAVVSANGGLLVESVPSVPSGYARLAPYQVMLNLAGDAGATAQASCNSASLTAGAVGCEFRGPANAAQGLRLPGRSSDAAGSFIRVSSPGYGGGAILIASNAYTDRLTVTISPAT